MGEWITPDHAVLLAGIIDSPAFGITDRTRGQLCVALRESGFLVDSAYYVPDADELFDMYRQLGEVDYHGRGRVAQHWLRWVMCGETQQALQHKYGKVTAVHTPNLDLFITGGGDLTEPLVNEIHLAMTTRAAASIPRALDAGRLFDMPIRRDPAARRPLFELIPESERS